MRAITMLRWLGLVALLAAASGAEAQQPGRPVPPRQAPPMRPRMRMEAAHRPLVADSVRMARMDSLRLRVEERFAQVVRQDLQLNDQQLDRVRQAMRANQDRRRNLNQREMELRRAVEGQMQPGVAANQDSLNRLLDAIGRLQVEKAQLDQQHLRDLQFLTPVQRARLLMLQHRFMQRMQEIRMRQQPGMMGPGARPGPGPRPDGEEY